MPIVMLDTSDLQEITAVYQNSFPSEEADATCNLMCELTTGKSQPETFAIGYKRDGRLLGAVGFSPVYFERQEAMSGYILSPLAVHSDFQRQGIATKMIEHGKKILTEKGVDVLLVYGDPNYYGRYGFKTDLGELFIPPYPLEYPFGWQAIQLSNKHIYEGKYKFSCVAALSDPGLW